MNTFYSLKEAKFQGHQEVTIINGTYKGASATVVTTNRETMMVRVVIHHNWTETSYELPAWIHEDCLEAK